MKLPCPLTLLCALGGVMAALAASEKEPSQRDRNQSARAPSGLVARQDRAAPPPPVAQPIPFSHRAHAAVGLTCRGCHAIEEPGFAAGFPKEAICMTCHATTKADSPAIETLKSYYEQSKPVPWARVDPIPAFVFFAHSIHHDDAGISCDTCHGPIAKRDVLARAADFSMAACMACHDRTGASNECGLCHDR